MWGQSYDNNLKRTYYLENRCKVKVMAAKSKKAPIWWAIPSQMGTAYNKVNTPRMNCNPTIINIDSTAFFCSGDVFFVFCL